MEENIELQIETNLFCNVCGEKEFNLREGYYYCQECGTKHEQIRDIEVECDPAEYTEIKHVARKKIHKAKAENPEITSWECYNYILRGLVEELLALGAKEEFKLMTLQVWAAYLRCMEVAFFNKKHVELPKLGVRYLKRDARVLYNHGQELRKKRKRRRSEEASLISGSSSKRNWRKSVRQLDESAYSQHSVSQTDTSCGDISFSQTSGGSNSSGTTSRAIQLKFSTKARKYLKRTMNTKHLAKHELDGENRLNCHKMIPKVRSLNRMEHAVSTMNIKQLYAILGIALNLAEDEIQLNDLVRFIGEGHLSANNILQYFPENIVRHGKQLLREINFYNYQNIYTDKVLRDHVGLLAKNLYIKEFKKPDIVKLSFRYISNLNLPDDLNDFVERLINLLPPQMHTRVAYTYPAYEARAIAYIVFVLKLLFGLDAYKEECISKTAQSVNQRLQQVDGTENSHPKLFVWSEWVEYVEMRKIIVSQHNIHFGRQHNVSCNIKQFIEQREEELLNLKEQSTLESQDNEMPTTKVSNMQKIFTKFVDNFGSNEQNSQTGARVKFQPSFMPAHFYFKRLLLHSNENTYPEYMHVDHTKRSLLPYLDAKSLREYFKAHQIRLQVLSVECNEQRCYAGVFRVPSNYISGTASVMRAQQADFEIKEEQWLKELKPERKLQELEFKTSLDSYEKRYMKKLLLKQQQRSGFANETFASEVENATHEQIVPSDETENISDVLSMHSIEVFRENNMEPIETTKLKSPRRHLGLASIFAEFSEEADEPIKCNTATKQDIDSILKNTATDDDTELTLLTSKMDCWMLLGSINALNEQQKSVLQSKFPSSFFWLLDHCAQTIGVDWSVIYEQLLAIELMFAYGIEKLEGFQDYIHFRYNNPIKDYNVLVNSYREIW